MSGWDTARRQIENGERVPSLEPTMGAVGASGIEQHMTRCKNCTRLARLDAEGLCRGCQDQSLRVVCAWHGGTISEGREPATHGICESCASYVFESPSGPRREVALEAEAERVARCERAGVKP